MNSSIGESRAANPGRKGGEAANGSLQPRALDVAVSSVAAYRDRLLRSSPTCHSAGVLRPMINGPIVIARNMPCGRPWRYRRRPLHGHSPR